MHVTRRQGKINLTPSSISYNGCFNTGVFKDVEINSEITSIEINLQALERYVSLSEIVLYIGRDSGDFIERNIAQDSARTWLVPEHNQSGGFDFDFLQISGSAHVGILPQPSNKGSIVVGEVSGDSTGSLHVGFEQVLNISSQDTTVLPFNLQTYKVCMKKGITRASTVCQCALITPVQNNIIFS